jgi:hypothetical protein
MIFSTSPKDEQAAMKLNLRMVAEMQTYFQATKDAGSLGKALAFWSKCATLIAEAGFNWKDEGPTHPVSVAVAALKRLENMCNAIGLAAINGFVGKPSAVIIAELKRMMGGASPTDQLAAACKTLESMDFFDGLAGVDVSSTATLDGLVQYIPQYVRASSADFEVLRLVNPSVVTVVETFVKLIQAAVQTVVAGVETDLADFKTVVERCRPGRCMQ